MFSMCSELTPCARIPDTRIPQLMQPCARLTIDACSEELADIIVDPMDNVEMMDDKCT